MRRALVTSLLALTLLATACDPFPEVRKQDTIEAYEQYLKEHPTSNYAMEAKSRLETLMYEKAKKDESLEAYDAYLNRFPKGIFREKAYKERETYLWDWAEQTHSVEGWDRYIKEYPQHDARKVRDAKRRKKAAEYLPNLAIGEISMEQVNLAEDPDGPLNGWMFKADITNNGSETLTYLNITIQFLDDTGKKAGEEKWPVDSASYGIPVEEEKKVPIKPGETRTWELMTGNTPEGWTKKARLQATAVTFEERTAGP